MRRRTTGKNERKKPVVPRKRRAASGRRLILASISVIGMILTAFVILPAFTIQTVELSGIENDQVMRDELHALKGRNMLFLRTSTLEKKLAERYAYTANISVTKQLPQTLGISVEQRIPIAQLVVIEPKPTATQSVIPDAMASASASRSATPSMSSMPSISTVRTSYLLDKHRVPFTVKGTTIAANYLDASNSGKRQVHLPYIVLEANQGVEEGKPIDDDYVKQAVSLTQVLVGTPLTVKEFRKQHAFTIQANFDGPFKVLFSTKKDAENQIAALQTVLLSSKIDRKRVSIIDLRFDKPAVTSQ